MGAESLYFDIVNLVKNTFIQSTSVIVWFATPLPIINITPLNIMGIAGLWAFIGIAITKWATS